MTFSFENSRCKEIIEAAAERTKNNPSNTLPLEVRIVLLLTIRVETAQALNPRFSKEDRAAILDSQARMLFMLIPELMTDEGRNTYKQLAGTFLRDMTDLVKNHD